MANITQNKFSEEAHPWNWHIPVDANRFLLGTFPTDVRNRKQNFFYCSSTNRFWEVLSAPRRPGDVCTAPVVRDKPEARLLYRQPSRLGPREKRE